MISSQCILENLTTAVLWFDPQLRLQFMNPAAENLLEISAKQMKRTKIDIIFPRTHLCQQTLRQVLQKRFSMIERGIRLPLMSGRKITVDCSIIPIDDEKYHDHILVELKQIDQQLRITREENLLLQQQITRNVVRGLAHEIKNPLGGLRGAAQLLERELPDDSLIEYTDIIIEEADRLQSLLNRILQPHQMHHKAQTNIHQIIMRVKQLILSEIGNNVTIECDLDPSIPELAADSDQLIQAILNIMRNAVQAMNGKGQIKLRTRIRRQMTIGNKHHKLVVQIDITDNGPGIPQHMLDQIFYPLVTGRADGTGLGLSISQFLINQHGGLIECESIPQKTTFTLWLPMEQQT